MSSIRRIASLRPSRRKFMSVDTTDGMVDRRPIQRKHRLGDSAGCAKPASSKVQPVRDRPPTCAHATSSVRTCGLCPIVKRPTHTDSAPLHCTARRLARRERSESPPPVYSAGRGRAAVRPFWPSRRPILVLMPVRINTCQPAPTVLPARRLRRQLHPDAADDEDHLISLDADRGGGSGRWSRCARRSTPTPQLRRKRTSIRSALGFTAAPRSR